jgi:hypothetical protein
MSPLEAIYDNLIYNNKKKYLRRHWMSSFQASDSANAMQFAVLAQTTPNHNNVIYYYTLDFIIV